MNLVSAPCRRNVNLTAKKNTNDLVTKRHGAYSKILEINLTGG
jgi:hypothetical protein